MPKRTAAEVTNLRAASILQPSFREYEASGGTSGSAQDAANLDPWIFRDGQKSLSGPALVAGIFQVMSRSGPDSLADALIRAGELEAGISDAGDGGSSEATQITDAFANALCTGNAHFVEEARQLLEIVQVPGQVNISPPEGFTYYALHPLDFAGITLQLSPEPRACAVIGIRSIGTTLSAVVMASLKQQGRIAFRMTVRPSGHPYSRKTEFSAAQKRWIDQQSAAGAQFVIVDEGPGRSGSTFLSVADALLQAGVSPGRITLLGSRRPDPGSLLAEDATRRWSRFRFLDTGLLANARFGGHMYAGGGNWRNLLLPEDKTWPESWPQMERLKFVARDRLSLIKFEGLGRIGAETRSRAFVLAQAGFSPPVSDAGGGFLTYELFPGRRFKAEEIDTELLDFMAAYCAFRAENFRANGAGGSELGRMVEFNVAQEFGFELSLPRDIFATSNPVLADGRMQPYEWIRGGSDRFIKTDVASHGDDHFFPGPCDIVWDLAGLAIEWRLGRQATRDLLTIFAHRSGDHSVAQRFPAYMLAYSVFRSGFCRMASTSVSDGAEEHRLRAAYLHYRTIAEDLLRTEFLVPKGSRTARAERSKPALQ